MDVIFGGNQGVEDMARMADIRRRLGITTSAQGSDEKNSSEKEGSEVEDKAADVQVTHHEA